MVKQRLSANPLRLKVSLLVVLIAAVLPGACNYGIRDVGSVPDHPTFNGNIYPLFADHCLLCHGSPPNRGAPDNFRLDVYDDQGNVAGAKTMSGSALKDAQSGRMPPAGSGDGVGPNGLLMLERWIQIGLPQ